MAGTGDRLVIEIDIGGQPDPEHLADATYQLRRELGRLDLEQVGTPPAAQAPAGARGVDLAAIGTILVTLGQVPQLGDVLMVLTEWVSRDARRSARVELDGDVLEVTGLSARDQRRLIDDWLWRHRGR